MSNVSKALGVIAVVGLVAAIGVGAVYAQRGTPEPPHDGSGRGYRDDRGAKMGLMAIDSDEMHAKLAELLGIPVDEFEAALADGETLFTLAEKYGVSFEDLRAAMEEFRAEVLAQAVADGTITQEQADWILERHSMRGDGIGGGFGRQHFDNSLQGRRGGGPCQAWDSE